MKQNIFLKRINQLFRQTSVVRRMTLCKVVKGRGYFGITRLNRCSVTPIKSRRYTAERAVVSLSMVAALLLSLNVNASVDYLPDALTSSNEIGALVTDSPSSANTMLKESINSEHTPYFVDQAVQDAQALSQAAQQSIVNNRFDLITHGRPGELLVNGQWLNALQIVDFIRPRLQNSPAIFGLNIYGCEFAQGEKGQQAVAYLETALGIAVAASDDITGIDGDWDLEVHTASAAPQSITASQWLGNLQVIGGTNLEDDFDGDGVINLNDLDDDNDGILDLVEGHACDAVSLNQAPIQISGTGTSSNVDQGDIYQYPNVLTVGTTAYDLRVEIVEVNFTDANDRASVTTTGIDLNNVEPRQDDNIVTEYSLVKAGTAELASVSLIEAVYKDIDGFRRNNPPPRRPVLEITGPRLGEFESATLMPNRVGGLAIRPFRNANGASNGATGFQTYTQRNNIAQTVPNNQTRNDLTVVYKDRATFQAVYGSTGTAPGVHNAHFSFAIAACVQINTDVGTDTIPEHFDLDSDGDMCPDSVEAYNDLTAIGTDGVDTYGDGPLTVLAGTVNADGTVVAASPYSVPTTTVGGLNAFQEGMLVTIDSAGPLINQQSCTGGTVVFSAMLDASPVAGNNPLATANTGMDYQWQISTDGGTTWADIAGENGTVATGALASLTLTNATAATINNNQYRLLAQNEANICGLTTASVTASVADCSIQVHKTISSVNDDSDGFQVGDIINYAFSVTNPGTIDLSNVTISDPLLVAPNGSITGGPIATLAAGATNATTITGAYTIQPADITAQGVQNSAIVSAKGPGYDPTDPTLDITDTSDAGDDATETGDLNGATDGDATNDPTVQLLPAPSLSIEKVGTYVDNGVPAISGVSVGDTISYVFTVTNTGNMILNDLTITDPLLVAPNGSITGGPIATLAVGASDNSTITGSYTIQQADITAGSFTNSATVSGTPENLPNGTPVPAVTDTSDDPNIGTNVDPDGDGEPDDPTVTNLANPRLEIEKVGMYSDSDGVLGVSAGDTISYAFTVRNTGNMPLTNVTVTDSSASITGGPIATLGVGISDSATFTGSYTIQQADIDAGEFENVATATGTGVDMSGNPIDVSDTSDDPNIGTNIDPDGDGEPDDPTVTNLANPRLEIEKASTYNDDDGVLGVSAGDTISYVFTVRNTGNMPLTNVTVADTLLDSISGGPIASLGVGISDSTTFTGSYTIQQADIDAGEFENVATATGTGVDMSGNPIDVSDTSDDLSDTTDNDTNGDGDPDDPTVTNLANPRLEIEKVGTFVDSDTSIVGPNAGDTITYAFTVTNTGNVPLTGVTVTDTALVAAGGSISGGPIATLAVGASDTTTFTGSYTILQADVDAVGFTNTATASGTGVDMNGAPIDVSDTSDDPNIGTDIDPNGDGDPDDPTFTYLANPGLEVTKAATLNDDDGTPGVSAGDTIRYVFSVTNTGNVDLSGVAVTDALLLAPNGSISNSPIASIAVGDPPDTTVIGTYIIQQADIDAGSFTNNALATGTPPALPDGTFPPNVTDESDDPNDPTDTPDTDGDPGDPTTTSIPQAPLVSLDKTLNALSPVELGNGSFQITYDMSVENTGNVTLLSLQIEDNLTDMINTPHTNNATFSDPVVTSPTLTPNAAYDGTTTNVELLSGTDSLQVGEIATLSVSFMFTPDVYFGPFENNATVTSAPSTAPPVEDSGDAAFVLALDATTPITLGWFKASEQGFGEVLIEWITETEVANAGFYLWSEDADGNRQQLNADMIVSQGDSLSTQHYQYLATDITPGSVFMITDVSVTGKAVEHGPFVLNQAYGAKTQRKGTDWKTIQRESEQKQRLREQKREHELKRQLEQLQGMQHRTLDGAPVVRTATLMEAELDLVTAQKNHSTSSVSSALGKVFGFVIGALVAPAEALEMLNFEVETAAIYRVTYADIAGAGVNLSGVSVARIGLKEGADLVPIKLETAGASTFEPGSFIEFTGQGVDTLYSGTNKYTLVLDEGQALINADDRVIPVGPVAYSYLAEQTYAPQTTYTQHSPDLEDSWYADRLVAISNPAEKSVVLTINDHAPVFSSPYSGSGNGAQIAAKKPTLEVALWGGSALPGNGITDPDHHVLIDVNGVRVVDDRFDGLRVREIEQPLGQIIDGSNNIKISLPKDHGYPFDIINIDRISLAYPRRFNAEQAGTSLVFGSSWNKFRVRKLAANSATVYRVSPTGEAYEMLVQDGQCYGGTVGCLLTFAGDSTGESSTYYVATDGGIKKPTISSAPAYEELFSGSASHLLIAHPDFINAALNNYESELAGIYGSADIVNVEAIYAQYSGHVMDAAAIQAYIQDAYAQRGTRQVTLVGGDMYDYHGRLQTQAKSFVPSVYVQIALNVNAVPSDAKYADIDGDNIPDIEVTRLPVRTEGELATLLAKRQNYIGRSYHQDAVFVADKTDGSGYVFKTDAEGFVQNFPGWEIDEVYLDDLSAPEAKQALIGEINAGVSLTSYVGHSHTDRWSFDNLLSGTDIAALTNANQPTVVAQWGCWNTFYVSPTEDSIAHRFLLEGNNGAVVVMGATSLASASAEKAMANLLYSRLAQGMRLGEAVLSAKRAFAQSNPYQYDILLGWAILGPSDLVVN